MGRDITREPMPPHFPGKFTTLTANKRKGKETRHTNKKQQIFKILVTWGKGKGGSKTLVKNG